MKVVSTHSINNKIVKSTSSVFSRTSFQKIAHNSPQESLRRKSLKYSSSFVSSNILTYQDFFEHLYNSLELCYRNEFFYKNEIVKKILLGRHSLNTTSLFNEFKISKSIADLVMLNGTSVVYEIKTEYDSPERLLAQIKDYRKAFLNVIIVTHYSVVDKYNHFLNKNNLPEIGLLYLNKKNRLSELRKPKEEISYLEIETMFKCLRKNEYLALVKDYFGYIPTVPNTRIFKECLNLSKKIEPKDFHDLMFNQLKKRNVSEKNILSSPLIPDFLKYISITSNFTKAEIEIILTFLNKHIKV